MKIKENLPLWTNKKEKKTKILRMIEGVFLIMNTIYKIT